MVANCLPKRNNKEVNRSAGDALPLSSLSLSCSILKPHSLLTAPQIQEPNTTTTHTHTHKHTHHTHTHTHTQTHIRSCIQFTFIVALCVYVPACVGG